MAAVEVREERSLVSAAAVVGIVGPAVFVLLVLLNGALSDGYTHVGQKISELGGQGAQYAWLQNLNFVVLGASVIALAWALARRFGRPYTGPLLIAMFGVSACFLNAAFPCDAGCAGETTVGALHNATGLLGFVSAIAGMTVLARRWRRESMWDTHVVATKVLAAVAVAGLAWFIGLEVTATTSISGLAQRVFVLALLTWFALTGMRLARDTAPA